MVGIEQEKQPLAILAHIDGVTLIVGLVLNILAMAAVKRHSEASSSKFVLRLLLLSCSLDFGVLLVGLLPQWMDRTARSKHIAMEIDEGTAVTCWIYLLITILVRDFSNMVKLFIAATQAWSLIIKRPIQEAKKHINALLSLFLLAAIANLTTTALVMEHHNIVLDNTSFSSEVSFCGLPDIDAFKFLLQLETALVSTRYLFFCVCIVITEIGIRNLRKVRLRFIPASQIQTFMRNSNPVTVSTARAVMITNSMMLLCYTMYFGQSHLMLYY